MPPKVANKVCLISIDGWGLSKNTKGNAILAAKTPHMDELTKQGEQHAPGHLYAEIDASGLSVGLPRGNMGNSEVGHLTMGAGRVQYQDLVRINQSIEDKTFADNDVLKEAFKHAIDNSGRLHLLGLISDGGVHSHINHLFCFLEAAKQQKVPHVYIHFFADGRDTKPTSGTGYLKQLQEFLQKSQYGKLATITGRYYAMDRDKRWDRIEVAYNMLVGGEGEQTTPEKAVETVQKRYDNKENDEFLKPIVVDKDGVLKEGDTCIFFNYRSDRMREIVEVIGARKEHFEPKHKLPKDLKVYQMTQYDIRFKSEFGLDIIYPPVDMKNVLAEWISSHGLKQFHTAETEKYAHVTFFFNGGREEAFDNEDRQMVQSPKVPTYDLEPPMSQKKVGESLIAAMAKGDEYPFVMCNLAAPDMVGHTGKYEPAVEACTVCDEVIGAVHEAAQKYGYTYIVTADHGNAEEMEDENGKPKTSHTTNHIPFIVASGNKELKFESWVTDAAKQGKPAGGLSNVAPTICTLLGLDIPKEMTSKSMIAPLK